MMQYLMDIPLIAKNLSMIARSTNIYIHLLQLRLNFGIYLFQTLKHNYKSESVSNRVLLNYYYTRQKVEIWLLWLATNVLEFRNWLALVTIQLTFPECETWSEGSSIITTSGVFFFFFSSFVDLSNFHKAMDGLDSSLLPEITQVPSLLNAGNCLSWTIK